ncbi:MULTISPECIES: GtrA family protein [Pseudomonas]|uniref:GtrA family protein n=1 Tax=Pseudomonas quercus TaxID=2722792 RepID=A0ABX0YFL3_9PSED|nr:MULTISPECIES: GtrA family protein [Pseudomonas]MBF7143484.1 GtrA family protein [Pseudomonas sp. LY10J]NJP02150.1 GtrA family protein [Pseudomonas quercus]
MFLLIGSLTVVIDFLAYKGLLAVSMVPVGVAKTTGFIAGTIFSYCANKVWTFGHANHVRGSVWRFAVLYIVTLLVNVNVNSFFLEEFAGMRLTIVAAFLVATGVTAVLNFLGMKFFVFSSFYNKGPQ